MADFVSAEITQEIIDAKNKLNQQADRAESLINSWENGVGGGDMFKATYDPTGVQGDAFKRSNMTGEQAISTITGLQPILDAKTDDATHNALVQVVATKASQTSVTANTNAINTKASTTDLSQGLATKQASLVSGTNIKTINGESLLGSGNITITSGGGGGGAVDSVNGETGVVVLDAGDIDETASRIYFTPAEKSKLQGLENYSLPSDVVQDANYVATENSYTTAEKSKLAGIAPNANNYTLPSDVVQDSTYVKTANDYTNADKSKLAGIAAGAEVNTVSPADLEDKEDSLGNPTTDGQILSSTTAGVGTWIDAPEGGGGGDVRTPISLADLATTARILAKGEGKYYHTFEGMHYAMEIPTRRDWMIDITVSPSGDGAYLKAVSLTQADYGIYRKFIKNGSDSSLCPWIKDKFVPIASVQASGFDMTNFNTILASMKQGDSFCGDLMVSTNPTGGAGSTHRHMEIFYEGSSKATRFEIVARGNRASPLRPKGRVILPSYDSGWVDFE